MKQDDLTYYERRLNQEVAEAERSDRTEVRQVHLKLADLYRERIRQLATGAGASTHRFETRAVQAIMHQA